MRKALLLGLALAAGTASAQTEPPPWGRFFERLRTDQYHQKLSAEAKPADAAFVGAEVVPMTAGATVLHDQTVIVRGGRIDAIGPRATTKVPEGMKRIDARGKFLFPGLTDVHVHTLQTHADLLVDLLYGVTTIREMDGYPWLLKLRDAARANRILAPTSYVAGTILNAAPMGWYAIVVKTPEQARQIVREQKAAGYDYIKVHNAMPQALYDAIAQTAREEHIRLVGHIPHQVLVQHAVEAGQFTFEHFKGFYLDTNLTMSPENWLEAIKDADVWIAPTLTNRRGGMSVEETRAFMKTPDAQLVSARARAEWPDQMNEHDAQSCRRVWTLSQDIFRQLLPVTRRFIAGTDSGGGYANSIRGFALHDELETMESLGLPPLDALRATSVNASIALGDPNSFGTIEPGKRADLLLLDKNPLLTVRNLRDPRGVMVRGIWLDAAKLGAIRKEIAAIYAAAGADKTLDNPSAAQLEVLVAGMQSLGAQRWIFNDHHLEQLAAMLRDKSRPADADKIVALAPAASR
jgi:imidazolonepropionase-like amidohydrolase